jgi:hypothetical protein
VNSYSSCGSLAEEEVLVVILLDDFGARGGKITLLDDCRAKE